MRLAKTSSFTTIAAISLVAVTLGVFSPALAGQGADPPYVAQMPSVDRVKSLIQGKDETESQARQIAVFSHLSQIVDRIRMHRGYSAPFTPGEQKIKGEYDVAAYQMMQNYSKTHSKQEADDFGHLEGRFEFDSAFTKEWYEKVLSPDVRSFYETGQVAEAAHAKAHFDAERQSGGNPNPLAQKSAGGHSSIGIFGDAVDKMNNSSIMDDDPETKAARRCLELGGTKGQCLAEGTGVALVGIMETIMPGISKPSKEAQYAGLMLGGTYRAANGLVLTFAGNVAIDGCGKLVADGRGYKVTRRGADAIVEIANESQPIRVVLNSSGQITGAGLADVVGRIITGYHHYTVWKKYADGTTVPGTMHEEVVPIYAPHTERCNFVSFRPDSTPIPNADAPELFGFFFGNEQSEQSKLVKQHPTPAGLRMAGTFRSAGGLRMEFRSIVVTLDCGEAHTLATYSVRNTPDQLLVTIDNRSGPFTVALGQTNSLKGQGTANVSGRLVTGETRDGFNFRPISQSCAIGTLAPQAN